MEAPTDLQHVPLSHSPIADAQDEESTSFGAGMRAVVQHHIPRLAASVGGMLQPQGDTNNDDSAGQRIVNVLTSLPFLFVGANMLR